MALMAVLFGIAANVDNFGIGAGYGVRGRFIPFWHNLAIATTTTLITLGAFAAGGYLRNYIPERAPDTISGSLFLLFALCGTLFDFDDPSLPPQLSQTIVTPGETIFLAGNLSINNCALAFAAGLGAMDYIPFALSVFAFSVIMLDAGQMCGRRFVASLPWLQRAPLFGNLILVGIGVLMLCGI